MKIPIRSLTFLAAAAVALLLAGCNTVSVQSTESLGVPNYPPTSPDSVQVLNTAPTAPHIRLGEITVQPQGSPTREAIQAKLQQAAAKMGANAVVIVADRTQVMGAFVTGPWWGRSIQPETGRVIIGVAIRYTP